MQAKLKVSDTFIDIFGNVFVDIKVVFLVEGYLVGIENIKPAFDSSDISGEDIAFRDVIISDCGCYDSS